MQPPGWPGPSALEQDVGASRKIGDLPSDDEAVDPARRITQATQRQEDFLRSSVDWLWETDAEMTLTHASSPVALELGVPAQILIGRPLLHLGRFAPGAVRDQRAEAAMAARRPFRKAVFVMTGEGKRDFAYHLSGVPYFDQRSGRFGGYRGTATAVPRNRDMNDQAEQEMRALATTLEETLLRNQDLAWRFSRIENQAAPETDDATLERAAHELRTPLNAILGYADLALEELFGPLGERYQDCFRTIREAGRHMDQVILHLRGAETPEGAGALATETVEVAAVLVKAKAIVALAGRAAEVDLSRVGALAGGRVLGDPAACAQILVNLLTNAVKFTPAGGAVGVETLVGSDGMLQIAVWDTGIGITEDEQASIFDPSYRVHQGRPEDLRPGQGLGLAVSRDLARAMKGDITVSSQPGHGARFTLSLPVAPRETTRSQGSTDHA